MIRGKGRLGAVGSTVAIIAFALVLIEGLKVIETPWAVSWLPGPKLAGTYAGRLQAEQRSRYFLVVDLEYYEAERQSRTGRTDNLAGKGRLCSSHGETYDYRVSGHASRDGDFLGIWLTYPDPSLSRLTMWREGAWRGDVVEFKPSKDNPFAPDGSFDLHRPSSTADLPDGFLASELRRVPSADFPAECRALRS